MLTELTEEEKYVYTLPLTYGELCYSLGTGQGNSSKLSYDHTIALDGLYELMIEEYSIQQLNPLRRKYENGMVKSLDELSNLEKKIRHVMCSRKFPLPHISRNERIKYIFYNERRKSEDFIMRSNQHFDLLTPNKTMTKMLTDCKGLAIFALTFFRERGVPTKLATSRSHVFLERWNLIDKTWFYLDPKYVLYSTKLRPMMDVEYEEYYKKIILHFNGKTL